MKMYCLKLSMVVVSLFFFLSTVTYAQIKVVTGGNVIVGTDDPSHQFEIDNGTGSSYLKLANGQYGEHYGLIFKSGGTTYNGGQLIISSSHNFRFCLNNEYSGEYRLGIGTTSPSCALDVVGQAKVNGSFVLTSDERLKTNIKSVSAGLNYIKQLHPVSYERENLKQNYIASFLPESNDSILTPQQKLLSETKRRQYGFVAQSIREVFPDLVFEDSDGYLSVDYIGIIPILVSAVKEQQDTIEELKTKVDELMAEKEKLALKDK